MKENKEVGPTTGASAQAVSIKDRIIARATDEYGLALKKFETAVGKLAEIKRKIGEHEERNDQLRAKLESLKQEIVTDDTVDQIIKMRRQIPTEIGDNEEIIRLLEGDILRAAETGAHEAGAAISGGLMQIIFSIKAESQQEINRLFDQINSLIKDFDEETFAAVAVLVGRLPTFITLNDLESKKMIRSFDVSRAPQDNTIVNSMLGHAFSLRR